MINNNFGNILILKFKIILLADVLLKNSITYIDEKQGYEITVDTVN